MCVNLKPEINEMKLEFAGFADVEPVKAVA
jgi:hypothetical protein